MLNLSPDASRLGVLWVTDHTERWFGGLTARSRSQTSFVLDAVIDIGSWFHLVSNSHR